MRTIGQPVNSSDHSTARDTLFEWLGVAFIVVLGLTVRGVGLGYDLPFIYHPDEPLHINIIQRIFDGDLNPRFFNYPSLSFYINALVYLPVFGIFALLGRPVTVLPVDVQEMGITLAFTPQAVLVSRWVTVLVGIGCLLLVYWIARRFTGRVVPGLLAALFLSISPTAVRNSRFITPDTFAVFFVLAAVFFSLCLYQSGTKRDALLAGVFAGLAASSKYNAGLVMLAPILALFMREGLLAFKKPAMVHSMLAAGLAFLVTSPFILLDAPAFWEDFSYEARHYSSIGHPGMEGDSFNWYLNYMWTVEGAGLVAGALAVLGGFVRSIQTVRRPVDSIVLRDQARLAFDWKKWLVVFAFPLVYFGFISRFVVRNDRTLLPVIPFLLLAAGLLIDQLLQRVRRPGWAGRAWFSVGVAILGASLVWPVLTLWQYAGVLGQPPPYRQAIAWVGSSLSPGTQIAVESYAPYLNTDDYQVTPIFRAIMRDADWYRNRGIEYVIFAESMYGRYYCEPERYAVEKAQYERLFAAFTAVAVFENPLRGGPLDGVVRALGDSARCPSQAILLNYQTIKIYQVR